MIDVLNIFCEVGNNSDAICEVAAGENKSGGGLNRREMVWNKQLTKAKVINEQC